MTPLEAVLLIVAVGLPWHLVVLWQMNKLADPAYLRAEGVVILREEVLEETAHEVGRYKGHAIWETVTFMGMTYRFDRIVPRAYRWSIGERELYLDPGLIYITK
jgi:hypothetical protein